MRLEFYAFSFEMEIQILEPPKDDSKSSAWELYITFG
jgi:hypothetical protein